MKDRFSFQPTLHAKNISLRPLVDSDYEGLFSCASDRQIWEGHPHPNRYKPSEFVPYFQAAMDSKACLVINDNSSEKIIGSSRFYVLPTTQKDISIGYTFLVRKYWGGKTNYELKKLMLDYAFGYFTTVWFHAGVINIRSQKAILKIGATFVKEETLNISSNSESWYCYKMEKEKWLSLQ